MTPPRELAARRFLFALLIASFALVAYVAWPLATSLLLAAVLAVVLAPIQRRLTGWLLNRPSVQAFLWPAVEDER